MAIQALTPIFHSVAQTSGSAASTSGNSVSFADFLGKELDQVNQLSQNANNLANSYATGGNVSTAHLMIAESQASLAVDTTVQVNNRVQDAYRTIMNMQV